MIGHLYFGGDVCILASCSVGLGGRGKVGKGPPYRIVNSVYMYIVAL